MIDLKHEIERELNQIEPPDLWDRIQADAVDHADAPVLNLVTVGHRRRTSLWLAVAAVLALFAVGVAVIQSGDGEPNLATGVVEDDDQALADAAALTSEDVPYGWVAASPEQEAQPRAGWDALTECLGTSGSDLQADRATATAAFVNQDNGNLEHLASNATVFSSSAEARAMTDQLRLPVTQRCYVRAIEQQIVERASAHGVTSIIGRPLAIEDLEVRSSDPESFDLEYYDAAVQEYRLIGDGDNAFLFTVTLSAEDVEVDVYAALTFVSKGRVALQLSSLTYFTAGDPASRDYLPLLTERILDRLPGAPADSVPPADPVAPVVPEPEPELPDPGEQPADQAAAEEQVRLAYTGIFDSSSTREARSQFSERPAVWTAANQQLEEGEYASFVEGLSAVVDEVVFTDPTHAAVRFRLSADNGAVPQAVDIGDAVLVDGRWLVAIDTTCALVAAASVQCDMSL